MNKKCNKCGLNLSLTEFERIYLFKSNKDQFTFKSICIKCSLIPKIKPRERDYHNDYNRKSRIDLSDNYIIGVLTSRKKFTRDEIRQNKSIIEATRYNILIKRALRTII